MKITLNTLALQSAFVAIASRLVGATFRVAETYNPVLQKTRMISDPQIVFKREAITIAMAWGFALFTNLLLTPLAKRNHWSIPTTLFLTGILGTFIAESVARWCAYRQNMIETTPTQYKPMPHNKMISPNPKALYPMSHPSAAFSIPSPITNSSYNNTYTPYTLNNTYYGVQYPHYSYPKERTFY